MISSPHAEPHLGQLGQDHGVNDAHTRPDERQGPQKGRYTVRRQTHPAKTARQRPSKQHNNLQQLASLSGICTACKRSCEGNLCRVVHRSDLPVAMRDTASICTS